MLDGQVGEGLFQAGEISLQFELAARFPAALAKRLADAIERLIAPAFDRRRPHAEAPCDLVQARFPAQQLENGLGPVLRASSPRPAPNGPSDVRPVALFGSAPRRRHDPSLLIPFRAHHPSRVEGDFLTRNCQLSKGERSTGR